MKKIVATLLIFGSACGLTLTPIAARQVTPLTGTTQPPHVIWLVDTSGSMAEPVNPSRCPSGCGAQSPCPSTCQTWQQLVISGVESMMAGLPASATHSLVTFPSGAVCNGPTSVDDASQPGDIINELNLRTPVGGTPTAAALKFVSELPSYGPGETYVVLATDGVPNCNPTNPSNMCSVGGSCRCTIPNCGDSLCSLGCLDEVSTVNASHQLADRGMRLLVVGVGPEVRNSEGSFSGMQVDLPRSCAGDAGCQSKLYLVQGTPSEFDGPGQRLAAAIRVSSRCTWWLPQEVVARDLSVRVGDAEAQDWTLGTVDGMQKVTFAQETCTRLLNDSTLTAQFSVRPR
jgi:hypothetical protein